MINCRIGTEYLDLLEGSNVPIAITKAISKIGEIDKRHGDLSIGFDVAWTSKNVKLLNYVTVLNGSTTNESFKKVYGQLVEDDVVISDGFFRVEQFNQYDKKIKVRFFGGNSDWFSLIKDKKINESYDNYDTSFLNFKVTPQNVADNFPKEVNHDNPYKYFLIDNNKNTRRNASVSNLITNFDDYQIAFSQGVIFDKIFESVGIKTQGNLFDDPKFYNTLINKPKEIPSDVFESSDYKKTFKITKGSRQIVPRSDSGSYGEVRFNEGDQIPEFDGSIIFPTTNASGFRVDFQVCVLSETVLSNDDLKYQVLLNQSQIGSGTLSPTDSASDPNSSVEYIYDTGVNFPSNTLNDGDEIEIRFAVGTQNDVYITTPSYGSLLDEYGDSYYRFTLYDYTFTKESLARDYIPDLNQDVFIKDVLTQFGVVTQYDSKTKTLTCNKLSLIENRKIYAPDWSDKIDLSVKPNVNLTKLLEKYGRRSFFKYSENDESDILNTVYSKTTNYRLGDGAIIIDNDFLEDDNDIYESPYSPTLTIETFPRVEVTGVEQGQVFIPFVPLFTLTGEEDVNGDIVPVYDENDLNPRKYIYSGTVNVGQSFKTPTTISLAGYVNNITEIPLVYFEKDEYSSNESSILNNYKDTLSFGRLSELTQNTYETDNLEKQTILGENYFFQNKILNKPIYLEIYLRLSPLDVQNVDFFTPIYLSFDLDSGYYYIDEISQYKGQDKSTKVKLVKI